MSRTSSPTKKASRSEASLATAHLRALKRGRKLAARTGIANVGLAAAINGVGSWFADPAVAVGYFSETAKRPWSASEVEYYRKCGAAIMACTTDAALPLSATAVDDVIVVLPIAAGDVGVRLLEFGMKLSRKSMNSRRFCEYRGLVQAEAIRGLVGSAGGTITLVERPTIISPDKADAAAAAAQAELEEAPASETAGGTEENATAGSTDEPKPECADDDGGAANQARSRAPFAVLAGSDPKPVDDVGRVMESAEGNPHHENARYDEGDGDSSTRRVGVVAPDQRDDAMMRENVAQHEFDNQAHSAGGVREGELVAASVDLQLEDRLLVPDEARPILVGRDLRQACEDPVRLTQTLDAPATPPS